MSQTSHPTRCRSIFISDVHLGTSACQAELLLDFLDSITCDHLFLVGDIIDGWQMRRGWRWAQSHHRVVHRLVELARAGARVTYIPGNHDDRVGDFAGVHHGGVRVVSDAVHETADGRRFLVIHGDAFDPRSPRSWLISQLGDLAYKALVSLNGLVNRYRRSRALRYWSLATFVKGSLGRARRFIATFEETAAAYARQHGLDGVICGHIHQARIREIDGVLYLNDGDWVESCTALVEYDNGRLEILDWAAGRSWSMMEPSGRHQRAPSRILEPAPA